MHAQYVEVKKSKIAEPEEKESEWPYNPYGMPVGIVNIKHLIPCPKYNNEGKSSPNASPVLHGSLHH